jgi:hypothetical protein
MLGRQMAVALQLERMQLVGPLTKLLDLEATWFLRKDPPTPYLAPR